MQFFTENPGHLTLMFVLVASVQCNSSHSTNEEAGNEQGISCHHGDEYISLLVVCHVIWQHLICSFIGGRCRWLAATVVSVICSLYYYIVHFVAMCV